ncbi:hypothetical protein GOP47_0001606 [Adiantum capillus-veneris]|uniref:Pentatricopeptide repeat-containing protein-mitochondrial domain-containing protein n=1 Tax=Adiantum capillus-veneris TaxID=13818 RepID=A0A9D4ZN83_ADICA|nr:hypothetical protein GOP47_0001606 [Adiantum capillus-veneris]
MSSFRGFFKLFYRRGIKAKEARGVHASHCVDTSPSLLRHSTLPNFKPAPDSPATKGVNINLLTGHGFLQFRGLHASLQAWQMSQPEAEEPTPSPDAGEVPAPASAEANVAPASVEQAASAAQGDKPVDATKGVLAPIVPGMPVVHRGASAPVVGHSLSIHGLVKEMTERIRQRLFEEAIQIYREWLQCIDPVTGKPNKPLVTPCNIALLAEGLKGAPVDVLLKRVEEMGRLGLAPNTDTFYVLFNAAGEGKDLAVFDRLFKIVQDLGIPVQTEWCTKAIARLRFDSDVWKAMDYVRIMVTNNLSPDDVTISKLVSSFSRIGQAQKATDLVRWGQKRDAHPSLNSLGDLLQACVESDVSEGALLSLELLFGRRKGRPVRNPSLDEGTLLAVLSLAARTGDVTLSTKAWEVLLVSLKQSHPPSEACFLARLHAATTGGDLDLAISTMQAMEKEYASAVNTEVFSPFTSLRPFVLGVARGGGATLDTTYFKLEALASTYQVPLSAINCVILGCANVWDIDRCYQTFEAIRSVFGLMPNVHSCNALIEGFAKMKKVPETLKVYEFMIGSGLHPDQRTFESLIKAHIVNRDTKSAMETVNEMIDAGFSLHKDLAVKLRRRFIRECDDQGARDILGFKQKFNYADGFTDSG